jgi:TPR repeat protein
MVEAGQYLERRDGEQGPAASRWYKRAAEKGSAEAAWALGINAEKGFGRSADWASAYKWFRRAAEISAPYGWKPGEYALAGIVSGVQAKEGLGLLRKAAQAKSAEAEFYMGLRAMCGIGCAIDTQLSRVWFERSAANPMAVSSDDGERCAHALLGRQLAFGARTRRAGIRHLEIAAATGLPLAKIDLALALLPRTRQWAPIARLLREGVGSYKGPWRRPGGVWLGIEPLTRARVVLACELLDLQMPRAAMTFGRVTMNFKCDDSR